MEVWGFLGFRFEEAYTGIGGARRSSSARIGSQDMTSSTLITSLALCDPEQVPQALKCLDENDLLDGDVVRFEYFIKEALMTKRRCQVHGCPISQKEKVI